MAKELSAAKHCPHLRYEAIGADLDPQNVIPRARSKHCGHLGRGPTSGSFTIALAQRFRRSRLSVKELWPHRQPSAG